MGGTHAFIVLTKIGQYDVIKPARISIWIPKENLLVIEK